MVYVMTYNTPVGNFLSVWSTRDAAIEAVYTMIVDAYKKAKEEGNEKAAKDLYDTGVEANKVFAAGRNNFERWQIIPLEMDTLIQDD
jgi:hypothetical protein